MNFFSAPCSFAGTLIRLVVCWGLHGAAGVVTRTPAGIDGRAAACIRTIFGWRWLSGDLGAALGATPGAFAALGIARWIDRLLVLVVERDGSLAIISAVVLWPTRVAVPLQPPLDNIGVPALDTLIGATQWAHVALPFSLAISGLGLLTARCTARWAKKRSGASLELAPALLAFPTQQHR